MNIGLLIIIGISLAMDSFSLALSFGTYNISKQKIIIYPLIVAFFHFIMPLLGSSLGFLLQRIITLNTKFFLFAIFLFIAIEMIIDLFSKSEHTFNLNFINMLLCAFAVSIDSLTVGIAFFELTSLPLLGASIFAIIAGLITYLGLVIGRFAYVKTGVISKVLGVIIMIILAMLQLAS